MKSVQDRIADLEDDLQTNLPAKEKFESLSRLFKNKDFISLILEGYLQDEAVRLVHLKASAEAASPESQFKILRDLDSIGALKEYFRKIDLEGQHAIQNIANAEAEIQLHGEEQ